MEAQLTITEIEAQLRSYKRQGFKWRRTGLFIDRSQFWAPNYFIDGEDIPNLDEHYKPQRLEFGNKRQIEDLRVLDLVDLLFNPKTHTGLWCSDNLN